MLDVGIESNLYSPTSNRLYQEAAFCANKDGFVSEWISDLPYNALTGIIMVVAWRPVLQYKRAYECPLNSAGV
jgi:hypothetical protein